MDTPIRDYNEGMPVQIRETEFHAGKGRLVIKAWCEAGYNGTDVDLVDTLEFVKTNMPELWESIDNG